MKILLFIDALGAGGAQRQIVGLACLLRQQGFVVELVTYHYMNFYDNILQDYNIPHISVKNAQNKKMRIFSIARYFQESKPDIVIAYQRAPALIASIIRLFNHRFRLIVSERNTSQEYTFGEFSRFNLYRIADYVVPNSYSQRDFIIKHAPFLKKKTIVITNFVNTNEFIPSRKNKKYFDRPIRLLTIARITPQKNILNYIKSISNVRKKGYDIFVDWYGYADQGGGYKEECLKEIQEMNLQDVFIFHDPIKNVITEYNNCSAFVLPSKYEGMPNVICEAMSCGVPILCSNICDNAKIVEDGQNGFLFDPLDIEQIVQTIIRFCNLNSDVVSKMSLSSRRIAEVNFSPTLFCEKYLSIIKNTRINRNLWRKV